jgi:hypothetical protein
MEKFQEIDIKIMGDRINNKDANQININIDINKQITNNSIAINVPAIPAKVQECKIIFFKI